MKMAIGPKWTEHTPTYMPEEVSGCRNKCFYGCKEPQKVKNLKSASRKLGLSWYNVFEELLRDELQDLLPSGTWAPRGRKSGVRGAAPKQNWHNIRKRGVINNIHIHCHLGTLCLSTPLFPTYFWGSQGPKQCPHEGPPKAREGIQVLIYRVFKKSRPLNLDFCIRFLVFFLVLAFFETLPWIANDALFHSPLPQINSMTVRLIRMLILQSIPAIQWFYKLV